MSDVDTNTNNVPDDKKVSSGAKPKNQQNTSDKEEKGGSCGC
jgi:hypothetical protein